MYTGNRGYPGDAQIVCSYSTRANKYEHFPIYRRETTKKTTKPRPAYALDRTGKPRDLQANIATDETIFLHVWWMNSVSVFRKKIGVEIL